MTEMARTNHGASNSFPHGPDEHVVFEDKTSISKISKMIDMAQTNHGASNNIPHGHDEQVITQDAPSKWDFKKSGLLNLASLIHDASNKIPNVLSEVNHYSKKSTMLGKKGSGL